MKTVLFYIAVAILGITVNVAANAMKFVVVEDGPVVGYSQGATADYENLMNAKFSDGSAHNPYMSNRSDIGAEFGHGIHAAGSEVIFVNRVLDTGEWYYSTTRFNDDGLNHIHAHNLTLPDGTKAVFVGFEDIFGGGDRDFNDATALFTNVQISPVPEPSTYLMLLAGLIIVGYATHKRGGRCGFIGRGIGGSGGAV